jgi:hypothetical protein
MRRTWTVVTPILALIVGGALGFAAGQKQGIAWGNDLLIRELDYGLTVHAEVASLVRVGDSDRALWWLDQWIDHSAVTVTSHPAGNTDLPGLRLAKVYRNAVPSTGPDGAAVSAALSGATDLKGPYFCPLPRGGQSTASGLDRLAGSESR